MPKHCRWKRILLKLSGETLGGKGGFGLNPAPFIDRRFSAQGAADKRCGVDIKAANYIAGEIKEARRIGVEVAVVIGGGNFIRGEKLSPLGVDRATADYMGMLGTVVNALALQSTLENLGIFTRVMSSLTMIEVAEPFIRRRALRHLEKGRVVIFCGGTGSPYFTTDTAAALRASEVGAEVILKATNVAGVFSKDPRKNKDAKFFKEIDPMEMVKRGLKVMDLTAVTLAMENKIPVIVFDVFRKGNLKKILLGQRIGSEINCD